RPTDTEHASAQGPRCLLRLAPRTGKEPPLSAPSIPRHPTQLVATLPRRNGPLAALRLPRNSFRTGSLACLRFRVIRSALFPRRNLLSELDELPPNILGPSLDEILEAFEIPREQRSRGFLKVRQVSGNGRHEAICSLLSASNAIFPRIRAPGLFHQLP